MDEGLSERKMQILRTLVDDYIKTAQPVGSRTISRKMNLVSVLLLYEMKWLIWKKWAIFHSPILQPVEFPPIRATGFMSII